MIIPKIIDNRGSLLLQLCNYALLGTTVDEELLKAMNAEDWQWIIQYASLQGVTPFLETYLESEEFKALVVSEEFTIDRKILLTLMSYVLNQQSNFEFRQKVMHKMLNMFVGEGIDVMFMKGSTLARYYPKPSLRACSDVDYFLFGESVKGDELLRKHGYKINDYFHHHTQSVIDGVLIENHYDFLNRKDHKVNRILDDELKRLASQEGRNYPFAFANADTPSRAYFMSPTMNAIFLMRHMSGHYASERVSFRQIYDLVLFLIYDGKNVDWEYVICLYEKSGMIRFARIIKNVITGKMGISIDQDCFPIEPEQSALSDRVWESIVTPPSPNTNKRYSLKYMMHELKTFLDNRWKHKLVYPKELYWTLLLKYGYSHIKRALRKQ